MTARPSHRNRPHFLVRYHLELLTLLALLFVFQSGLVPFDFLNSTGDGQSGVWFSARWNDLTVPDAIGNVFLYIPIGILVYATLRRACGNGILACVLTLAAGAGLSGSIEWIQGFSASRVSSSIDWSANLLGTALGTLIGMSAMRLIPRMVGAALYEFSKQPRMALLKAYCLALVVVAALPFSFSLDSTRLKQAAKAAHFVPFAALADDASLARDALVAEDSHTYDLASWRFLKRWSRWMAECISFAVFVWLLKPILIRKYGFGSRSTVGLVFWIGSGLAIGLSLLQLPILTRGFDSTDILFRMCGLGIGLVSHDFLLKPGQYLREDQSQGQVRRFAMVGTAVSLAYIIYAGLIPLTIDATHGGPASSIQAKGFLPFFAYFVTRFDIMMDDVMEKFLAYAVFALLISFSWKRLAVHNLSGRLSRVVSLGVLISSAIEFVQMYMPVRVASLTDPILAAAGCLMGVIAKDHVQAFYQFAMTREMAGPPLTDATLEPQTPLTLTDELIATLTEPHPDAPTETPPTRKPATPRGEGG